MAPVSKDLAGLFRDIPPAVLRRAREVAIERDMSLQELIVKALDAYCTTVPVASGVAKRKKTKATT